MNEIDINNNFNSKIKMLGIGIFDTLALYIFAAIGIKVVVTNIYDYFEFVLFLTNQNIKYYFPKLYLSLSGLQNKFRKYLGLNESSIDTNDSVVNRQDKEIKTKEQLESDVMNDILSKSKAYYDSMKTLFESKIKDISDPQLKNKIDQWYQKMKSIVDDPIASPNNFKDFKKKLNECSDDLFELMKNYE